MILGEGQQPFASPGEALAHFGVKGMRWGVRKDQEFSNWGKPYTQAEGLNHGSKEFELKKPEKLRVDHSAGFADIRPVGGYASESGRKIHDDLVSSLTTMRETYPAVADLKIIVAPVSHVRGGPGGSAQAAVLHTKPGEVHITYNDKIKDFSPRKQQSWAKWVPGTQHEGYVANHEMGHVIAIAGKLTPPSWDVVHAKTFSESITMVSRYTETLNSQHKAAMTKHGLSFKELSKLSPYAATSPSEAYAEAAGNYHTPVTNRLMSPETRAKVKAMLDDAGGKK